MKKQLAIIVLIFLAFPIFAQSKITKEQLEKTEQLFDLQFTESERDSALESIETYLKVYQTMHKNSLKNWVSPALLFDPMPAGKKINMEQNAIKWAMPTEVSLPQNKNDLAFYSIPQLAVLIKKKKITSLELTQFFIQRLKTWGIPCSVSFP